MWYRDETNLFGTAHKNEVIIITSLTLSHVQILYISCLGASLVPESIVTPHFLSGLPVRYWLSFKNLMQSARKRKRLQKESSLIALIPDEIEKLVKFVNFWMFFPKYFLFCEFFGS